MSIIENAKKDLKKKLPLPVNSFMREIYIVKKELSQQRGELSKLREENRKLLDEVSEIRQEYRKLLDKLHGIREDSEKQYGELKELRTENRKILAELKTVEQEKINAILQQSNACRRKAEESIWANVFNNATVNNNSW